MWRDAVCGEPQSSKPNPMDDAGHPGHVGRPLNLLIHIRDNFPYLPRIYLGQLAHCDPHAIQRYQWLARMPRMPRMVYREREQLLSQPAPFNRISTIAVHARHRNDCSL
jgi:hypothetical protein